MRRIALLSALLLFFSPQVLFAQSVKIVDFEGEVMVKQEPGLEWMKAKANLLLGPQAEVETKANSQCTLAFDKDWSNIITLKENTLIRIDSIVPGRINLTQGRVFTVIQKLGKTQEFQVRTPTAIAAARGTGWSTGYSSGVTRILCFLDAILLQALNNQGDVTGQTDVNAGSGIEVGPDGLLGTLFRISNADNDEWNEFMDYLRDLLGFFSDNLNGQSLEDAIWENKEDLHERISQDIRAHNESSPSHEDLGEDTAE